MEGWVTQITLLHSERPKLYTILAFLSAIGLKTELATIEVANYFLLEQIPFFNDFIGQGGKQEATKVVFISTSARKTLWCTVLQIRKGKRDNLGIIFHITHSKHKL